jgi:hypothetical protein
MTRKREPHLVRQNGHNLRSEKPMLGEEVAGAFTAFGHAANRNAVRLDSTR